MNPQETQAWAYDINWELSEQDEEDALLIEGDWSTLIECAADQACPKAELIEASLAGAVTDLVRGHRGMERIDAVRAQVASLPMTALCGLRAALQLYDLWMSPQPLSDVDCDALAKSLLMVVDHPRTKFNRTGHIFDEFVEYSKHNSSVGLVFVYVNPSTGQWLYGGRYRYRELEGIQQPTQPAPKLS